MMKKTIILSILFCSGLILANDHIQDEINNEKRENSTSVGFTRTIDTNSESFYDNELMIDYDNNKTR